MDDLDLLLEAGPTLQYTLYENDTQRLRVDIPIRAAFSLGISFLITRAGQRMAFIL